MWLGSFRAQTSFVVETSRFEGIFILSLSMQRRAAPSTAETVRLFFPMECVNVEPKKNKNAGT